MRVGNPHGRLKNNFVKLGTSVPKPPDILINSVLEVCFAHLNAYVTDSAILRYCNFCIYVSFGFLLLILKSIPFVGSWLRTYRNWNPNTSRRNSIPQNRGTPSSIWNCTISRLQWMECRPLLKYLPSWVYSSLTSPQLPRVDRWVGPCIVSMIVLTFIANYIFISTVNEVLENGQLPP